MNNKLILLRDRLNKLSSTIFKKQFSKKDLDICMNNIKISKSGDKVSFDFTPENITTYNASFDTVHVLLTRLSINNNIELPIDIKTQYYELYPVSNNRKTKSVQELHTISKKQRGRPPKCAKSENTHIAMPL